MKKRIALYLTFAVLGAMAMAICFTGCSKETGVETSSTDEEIVSVDEGIVDSRYDNEDYDRTGTKRNGSFYATPSTAESGGHPAASRIIKASSTKSSSSKKSSSSAPEASSTPKPSSSSAPVSSATPSTVSSSKPSSSSKVSTPSAVSSKTSATYNSDGELIDIVSKGSDESQWGEWKPV